MKENTIMQHDFSAREKLMPTIEQNDLEGTSSKYVRKKVYQKFDLLDRFENGRYSTEFMVYKMINWSPFLDTLAIYGHFVSNFIIVYLALNFSVSFFMLFNLICVCLYYTVASRKLQTRAMNDYYESGLQSQTDLAFAYIITKKFKISAFYQFLKVRKIVWKIQFGVVVVMACIGFPSTILFKVR